MDAGLYYLVRMIEGGEDPLYIARRLVRVASEDVGMADPHALPLAVAAYQACHFLGYPECDVHLAEAVVYLAKAPKSRELELAVHKIQDVIKRTGALPVPLHLRNAPTQLMRDIGYGEGYKYTHYYLEAGWDPTQTYLPDKLVGARFWRDLSEQRPRPPPPPRTIVVSPKSAAPQKEQQQQEQEQEQVEAATTKEQKKDEEEPK